MADENNNENDAVKEEEELKPSRPPAMWEFYVAGALGALALTCSDCLKNEDTAALKQISETIKTHFLVNFDHVAIIALAFIVLMGAGLCFVHCPSTKVGAFYRGLSVFAVLGVALSGGGHKGGLQNQFPDKLMTPHAINEQPSTGFLPLNLVTNAYAGQVGKEPMAVRPLGRVVINLKFPPGTQKVPLTRVSLRNADTMEIIGSEKIRYKNFTIQQPIGNYYLEIEAPNFRNSQTKILISEEISAYYIKMHSSAVPMSVQRLVMGNKAQEAHQLPVPERYLQIGLSNFRFRNYHQAVESYDKYLAYNPNDVTVLTYKGFSLYQLKRYQEAYDVLKKALAINPRYLMARLNLAKTLCAMNKADEATSALLGNPPLSNADLGLIKKDFELKRDCGLVYRRVVTAYQNSVQVAK